MSANFLASDFIAEVELPSLLKAAAEDGLQVCWTLVSACLYETSGLDGLQAAHDINRPLDSLTPLELNTTLARIAREIERLVNIKLPELLPPDPVPAERRQLTVLVCDLIGSTALSERLDPENWSAESAEVSLPGAGGPLPQGPRPAGRRVPGPPGAGGPI